MNKAIIHPLREWLLNQGRCAGCGRPLDEARQKRDDGVILVICSCARIFTYQAKTGFYRQVVLVRRE